MKWCIWAAAAVVAAAGCSGDDEKANKQRECDDIAASIRSNAIKYGIPPQGACNNPSPTVQQNFASSCENLRQCNAEVDKL